MTRTAVGVAVVGLVVATFAVGRSTAATEDERAVASLPAAAFAGAAPAKVPELPDGHGQDLASGLWLTIESTATPAGHKAARDDRRARLVALHVPEDSPPSAYVPAGPFKATWRGNINLRIRGDYLFSARGRGALKVTVNDAVVLDMTADDLSTSGPSTPAKLKRGENSIVAEYTSPTEGEASVRLLWSERGYPPEAVNPALFTFSSNEKSFRDAERVRHGRELFANLRCVKCHTPEGDPLSAEHAMPELTMDAPSLVDVGTRLKPAWMAKWIADPKSLRPDASMPRVFYGVQSEQDARDVAAYLGTVGAVGAKDGDPAIDVAAAAVGGRLFTGLGCINCHLAPDQEPAAAPAEALVKVPLKHVPSKYQPKALRAYLKDPDAHYAWTRMPDFKLSDTEADQLAAFLLSRASAGAVPPDAADSGDVNRGKTLFASSGCLNCHTGPAGVANAHRPPKLVKLMTSDWTRGCVAADDASRGGAPNFALSADQRGGLAAFAASDWSSLHHDNPAEFADRQVSLLNCTACHALDQQSDAWTANANDIADYERLLPEPAAAGAAEEPYAPDQSRPPLTWAGEKLRPEWAERFIAGEVAYKVRPWLRSRMPAFPSRARLLAKGLAAQHGFPGVHGEHPPADAGVAAVGRKLVGRNGGFSCNACHSIGPAPATTGFEAPAPNFAHVRDRLTKPHYDRWLWNPQRVQPGTRMPQFADAEGKTSVTDVHDGDAARQFESIWQYLLTGPGIRPAE